MFAPHSKIPVTAHREWGKPLSKGPVRALFVLHLGYQREVVELAQMRCPHFLYQWL